VAYASYVWHAESLREIDKEKISSFSFDSFVKGWTKKDKKLLFTIYKAFLN
jgi:hypothetical protein